MPIRETSFRIGSGRYLQQPDILQQFGAEVLRLGHSPLIIGGKTALSVARPALEQSAKESLEKYKFIVHTGSCNHPDAEKLCTLAKEEGYDVIVGVGGGVIMDFAKLVADLGDLPIINVPTSCATCACYTPLSVCYTPEGTTVGTTHFTHEVNAVLADSRLLSAQPPRLMLAGIFDAMAKFLEIKQRFDPESEDFPLGLDFAYTLSKQTFRQLDRLTETVLQHLKDARISFETEQAIFITLAVTGVISGIARGSNQCALAHKFYEMTRRMFFTRSRSYLHGEIVGVGLLLQNHFNGEEKNNDFLRGMMRRYGLPCSPKDLGIDLTEDNKELYYNALQNTSAIDENDPDELERLAKGLDYLWRIDSDEQTTI